MKALGNGEVIQFESNQYSVRPPEVKAPHQAAGGYRCEAVTASVGIVVHRGKKLIKTNWKGGPSERNDVCSILTGSRLVSCTDPDPRLNPGAATYRLTPGMFG